MHFRSQDGRVCIKPFRDKETLERQREGEGQTPDSHTTLQMPPAADWPRGLLAHYPSLQGVNLNSLGAGSQVDDGDMVGRSTADYMSPVTYSKNNRTRVRDQCAATQPRDTYSDA